MPRKTKTAAADQAVLPQIPAELLEKLIPGPVTPGQLEDIFQQFKKAFIQQALGAEMSHHLGYAPGQAKPEGVVNHRNGKSAKTVLTDGGALRIDSPRDRQGSFEPQLIGKHERRFTGFDDKIVAMYAAFYLQDRLRSMSGFFGAKRLEEVESLLRKEWRVALRAGVPRQTGDFPDINRIFGSTSFAFSKRFASNMNAMMKLSDNGASGQCIRAIGYDYINGALVHGGFFDPTAKSGFWLAGDYTKDTDPSNRDGATIPGLGTTQAASAKAVSLMLANLARNELISPAASAGIRVVMSDAISWIAPTIQSTHPDATILNKIGLAGSVHDCAIVQYSNAHYAFCALFSQGYGIEPLFAELDRLAQELFAVSMVRDGARTMVRVLKL